MYGYGTLSSIAVAFIATALLVVMVDQITRIIKAILPFPDKVEAVRMGGLDFNRNTHSWRQFAISKAIQGNRVNTQHYQRYGRNVWLGQRNNEHR